MADAHTQLVAELDDLARHLEAPPSDVDVVTAAIAQLRTAAPRRPTAIVARGRGDHPDRRRARCVDRTGAPGRRRLARHRGSTCRSRSMRSPRVSARRSISDAWSTSTRQSRRAPGPVTLSGAHRYADRRVRRPPRRWRLVRLGTVERVARGPRPRRRPPAHDVPRRSRPRDGREAVAARDDDGDRRRER